MILKVLKNGQLVGQHLKSRQINFTRGHLRMTMISMLVFMPYSIGHVENKSMNTILQSGQYLLQVNLDLQRLVPELFAELPRPSR